MLIVPLGSGIVHQAIVHVFSISGITILDSLLELGSYIFCINYTLSFKFTYVHDLMRGIYRLT